MSHEKAHHDRAWSTYRPNTIVNSSKRYGYVSSFFIISHILIDRCRSRWPNLDKKHSNPSARIIFQCSNMHTLPSLNLIYFTQIFTLYLFFIQIMPITEELAIKKKVTKADTRGRQSKTNPVILQELFKIQAIQNDTF